LAEFGIAHPGDITGVVTAHVSGDLIHDRWENASRTFIELLSALDRKRGKGQVVRVERVVVNEGGQAIVGNVQGSAPADTAAAPPLAIGHEAPGITLGDLIGPRRELVKAPLSGEGGGV
jgi:hypothetical protein